MADNKVILPMNKPDFGERDCGVVVTLSHQSITEMARQLGYIKEDDVVNGVKINDNTFGIYLK